MRYDTSSASNDISAQIFKTLTVILMTDKDLILETMVSNPDRKPGTVYTPETLQKYLFPNLNNDEVEFIIRQILKEKPELIKIETIIQNRFAVSPTGLINSFLKNGGFTKIEDDSKAELIKKLERESKSDKLLDLDLKLKQFESKIGKKIILAGFVITLLSFLITVLTLEFWRSKPQERANKQEIQITDQKPIKKIELLKDTLN